MYVIGTAGHVDHGKSALIKALTGIDPDRLQEEKERGLTIDLGFAWLELPNGQSVGVIDVPGHRDFVENMLAGVGGIDAALLVVAADESVMPQTREHLAILDLLEVRRGLVALNKIDLAEDQAWIELVTEDVADALSGTTLEAAPIVPVSAQSGEGLSELRATLQGVLSETTPRRDIGRPRLAVDRVFTVSGFGTVVTGTLIDGTFEVGQTVELQPGGLEARVRGLQSHKHELELATPGSRVAVNLSGVDKSEIRRGDVVTTPGWLRPTNLIDVELKYLPPILQQDYSQAHRPLKHNANLKCFTGAAEVMARVRVLGQDQLPPGESGWVQLQLREPVALARDDRFIVRVPSPPATVGGGVVVDPHPRRRHRRFDPELLDRLETLAVGTPADVLRQLLERRGPSAVSDLVTEAMVEQPAETLAELLERDEALLLDPSVEPRRVDLVSSDRWIVPRGWWDRLTDQLTPVLSAYHREFPLRAGMGREPLRSRLRLPPALFDAAMARASAQGVIVEEGATVRLPSHAVRFTPEQEARAKALKARFETDPYATPSYKACVTAVGEEMLSVLLDRGELLRVSPDVLFLPETYEEMEDRVRATIEREGSITLAEARDLFETSRKYAQALLEYMDEAGVTKRIGDRRLLA